MGGCTRVFGAVSWKVKAELAGRRNEFEHARRVDYQKICAEVRVLVHQCYRFY